MILRNMLFALAVFTAGGCAEYPPIAPGNPPALATALCSLDANQSAMKPGWQAWTCAVLDANSYRTGATYSVVARVGRGPVPE